MKKVGLFFLCLAVFLLAVAGGYVWLFLTPRGALRSDTPEKVMQSWLDGHDAAFFREEYLRQSPAAVTEFLEQVLLSGLCLGCLAVLQPKTAEGSVGAVVLGMSL